MQRRTVLSGTAASITAILAGCSGDTSSGDGNSDGGNGGSTPEPHEIGDTFTVGNGDQTVEYVVESATAYNEIGGQYSSEEASGVFAVLVLKMTNQTDETVDVSSNHLKMVNEEEQQFDADAGAGVYVDSDPRIDADSISFEQLNPGLSVSGAVVFDLKPGATYQLLVEPIGFFSDASSQRVNIGTLEE